MKKLALLLSLPLIFTLGCETRKQEDKSANDSTAADTAAADTSSKENVPAVSIQEVWATDTTLLTPESVLFDPSDSTLYVSNVNGDPTKKDKNGFISKVGLDGKIENLKWAVSLDAPKGMGVLGSKLYVTDIDRLVEIDKKTGKTTKAYKVPGAKFLNDIVEDTAAKLLYFTDMQDNKIYTFQNGKITALIDSALSGPNGLALVNGKLFLASNQDKTFKEIDPATKAQKVIVTEIGAGDGVEFTGSRCFLHLR
jgi:hypothetical protein